MLFIKPKITMENIVVPKTIFCSAINVGKDDRAA